MPPIGPVWQRQPGWQPPVGSDMAQPGLRYGEVPDDYAPWPAVAGDMMPSGMPAQGNYYPQLLDNASRMPGWGPAERGLPGMPMPQESSYMPPGGMESGAGWLDSAGWQPPMMARGGGAGQVMI